MAGPTGLPIYGTSFVGRAEELDAIAERFSRGARVVTVIGPGGIGKTRLAVEHAMGELRKKRPAWFADLAPASSPTAICHAVAVALDVSLELSTDGASVVEDVGAALGALGDALIVLDNFERVAEHAPATVGRWAVLAPRARFLATSRQRLGLSGEATVELGPLGLPSDAPSEDDSDSVRLFVERTRDARGDRPLGSADRALVEELVRRLDGWPLAIELAAARLSTASLGELLRGLEQRFDLLQATARDVPERQRTLESAIDWSWELLAEDERKALSQSAVFRDGFTMSAAREVLALEGDPARAVEALRNESLLHASPPEDERLDMRFRAYQAIAEYAARRLVERGEADAARRRHAEHFVRWGLEQARLAEGGGSLLAHLRLRAERENLIAAHEHALSWPDGAPLDRARLALGAALALLPVFSARGPNALFLETFERALAAAEALAPDAFPPGLLARGLLGRAEARIRHGRLPEALVDLERAEDLAHDGSDASLVGRVHLETANYYFVQGFLEEATGSCERALDHARAALDRGLEGRAENQLCRIAVLRGELDRAAELARAALEAHEELGDEVGAARARFSLGEVAMDRGDLDEGRRLHESVVSTSRALGDGRLESAALLSLAALAQMERRYDDAREAYERCVELTRRIGARGAESLALSYHAACLEDEGRTSEARSRYGEAVATARRAGNRLVEGLALAWSGRLEADADAVEAGAERLEKARQLLDGIGDEMRGIVVDVCACHVELARARRAEQDDPEGAAAIRRGVRAKLRDLRAPGGAIERSWDVRTALGLLERALPAPANERSVVPPRPDPRPLPAPGEGGGDLVVSKSGKSVRLPSGELVRLERRAALSLIIHALAEKHASMPGVPASVDELFAAGWPGQRAHPRSAASRVYVAISTLRRLGLKDVLSRHHDGYLLDPSVGVRLAD